ncbi:MAG: Hsp20/alpha crystallin family protein [Anaerolineaceae bacterium]|nr:Hsp20/alpha crystallin family protein [Anaerolineaceae bacterium]
MSDNTMQIEKKEIMDQELEQTRDRRVFSPFTDIYESDEEITLLVDLPGVNEKDIDVTLEKDMLTINANVEPTAMDGYSLAYAEYGVGDFHRKFRLTKMVDQDHINAVLKDGVLTIKLSKAKYAKTKKIAIQAK